MVALIDCNNFYVSCERLFSPALNKKPVIVLSNNDGCAISRSEEAKALGVQMAQPAFMLPETVARDIKMFSSNYTLYGDISARVMKVIRELVPVTEVYSIDEIFADLSTLKKKDLCMLGKEIRKEVASCTGIPVSVGIAQTKTLAKMANRYAKKKFPQEGIYCASSKQLLDAMLIHTSVGNIWGIGKQYEAWLKKNGFHTAMDLVNAPEEWIRKNMSVVGQRLLNELKGISCIQWETEPPARKNICTSRSFGQLVTCKKEMRQAVAKFTSACAEKLRRENTCARKMNVFIQTNPHRPTDRQYFQSIDIPLKVPTNLTTELIRYAMEGLEKIFQAGYNYQKCGVTVMDLVPHQVVQASLFDNIPREKEKKLMSSVDHLNRHFSRDMVRFATQDYNHKWKLKQAHLSQLYTTRWDQLPKAKAD